MVYSSLNNPKIKNLKKLHNKKYRDEVNQFIIEGEHLIYEAYQKKFLQYVVILENNDIELDIEKIFVTEKIMKSISALKTPSKYIGVCNKITNNHIGNRVMMLDNIQDPGNLGTIIRSSVAFNIDTLIVSADSVDVYNPKVIRATQGMIFKKNIIVCNLEKIIKQLKKQHYIIIGTDVNNGKNIKEFVKTEKFAIIMGNEGNGISHPIKQLCDEFVYLEMNNNCESLNVGVAASIILYELYRK